MSKRALLSRNNTLDVIKGICIILVIINHCSWDDAQRQQLLFPWWVDTAVPVFMLISGYVYEMTCRKKKVANLVQCYAPKMIFERIIRLTVPVLIVYIITLFRDLSKNGTVSYDIINTFLQGGRGPGSYYYPVMMQFIFVVPIIRLVVARYAHKGLLGCLLFNALFDILRVAYCMPVECYRFMVFRYTFVIACGCYLAAGFPIKIRYSIVSFCVGSLFLCMYLYCGYEPRYLADWTVTSFLASMYIVPLIGLLIKKCRLHFAPLSLLGRASYNIYLMQMFYYYALASFVYQHVENIWLRAVCSLAICLCGGILFYLIENPFTSWLRSHICTKTLLKKEDDTKSD